MKTKTILSKFFFLIGLIILFVGCTTDSMDEVVSDAQSNCSSKLKIIHMFDSDIAVTDSADYYIYQGDICFPKSYVDSANAELTRGAAITGRRWPNNKVYYTLDNIPNQYRQNIIKAIQMVEEHSYIDFVQSENSTSCIKFNYRNTTDWVAESDYLGMRMFGQNINLSTDAIQYIGTIAHEICHAMGMDHEQNRSDRDNYLSIDFSKMPDSRTKHQYTKYTDKGLSGVDIGDFDWLSIMLYESDKYMRTKDGKEFGQQRKSLSRTDMLTLAYLQPIGNDFTFYHPLGYDESVNTDNLYQRSSLLRCPEGATIGFEFKYLNNLNKRNLGGYNYDDFEVISKVRIVNKDNNRTVYNRTFYIQEVKDWQSTILSEIELPQGIYKTYVTLEGRVKGNTNSDKNNVLTRILYSPRIYLNIKKAVINGKSKNIPSEFGNEKRTLTFLSI